MTKEQRKDRQKRQQEMLNRRLSVSMDKYRVLRKLYNDAGVNIHIVKFGSIGDANMPDGEIDYYFNAARRLGPIADKHKIMIGFHNHTQMTDS